MGTGYRLSYLARPDEAGRFPTVLMLPGSDGLSGFDKYLAQRLARWGIACLILDIYPGAEDALVTYGLRTDKELIGDLDEAYEFIQSDEVDWAHKAPVGVLGIDIGGRVGLVAAAYRPWIGACAVAYAPLTGDEDREYQVADMLATLNSPTMGIYGTEDDLISPETVDEAQNRNQHGQWLLYDGAGHGFLDDDGPNYQAGAAADGFIRLRDFFLRHLPKAIEEDLG